jgi:DNA-binding transcriptional ArsR family regulator
VERREARSGKEGRQHRLESSLGTQVTTSRHLKSSRKMGAKEVLCIEIGAKGNKTRASNSRHLKSSRKMGAKETKHKLAILVI